METQNPPVNSTYLGQDLQGGMIKKSEYAIAAVMTLNEEKQTAHRKQSIYQEDELRNYVNLQPNRVYQEEPSTGKRIPITLESAGHPISLNALKRQVESMNEGVYTPYLYGGKIFFVPTNVDVRTAMSRSLESVTGSHVSGHTNSDLSTASTHTAYSSFGYEETPGLKTAADLNSIYETSGVDTAVSRTVLTAHGASPTVRTSASRTMVTASSKSPTVNTCASRTTVTASQMSPGVRSARAISTPLLTANLASPMLRTASLRSAGMASPATAIELIHELRNGIAGADEAKLEKLAHALENDKEVMESLRTAVESLSEDLHTARFFVEMDTITANDGTITAREE